MRAFNRKFGLDSTKTHLEGGNYYADKLLLSNCVRIIDIVNLSL